jgi:hypothetical protein
VNTRPEGADDTLPDIGADSVSDLRGRRVEVRQSGAEDYSLVGILPRVR